MSNLSRQLSGARAGEHNNNAADELNKAVGLVEWAFDVKAMVDVSKAGRQTADAPHADVENMGKSSKSAK